MSNAERKRRLAAGALFLEARRLGEQSPDHQTAKIVELELEIERLRSHLDGARKGTEKLNVRLQALTRLTPGGDVGRRLLGQAADELRFLARGRPDAQAAVHLAREIDEALTVDDAQEVAHA